MQSSTPLVVESVAAPGTTHFHRYQSQNKIDYGIFGQILANQNRENSAISVLIG